MIALFLVILLLIPQLLLAQEPTSFPRFGLVDPRGYPAKLTADGQLQLTIDAPTALSSNNPGGSGFPRYGFVDPSTSTGLKVDSDGKIHVTLTGVGGGEMGAPTMGQYWLGAPDATLTNGKDLSALTTGLVINTAGTPSAYLGTSCTNQFPRSLSASGAATCASVATTDLASVTGSGSSVALGTSPAFTTDIRTPLILGGTAVGSTLTLQSTSGVGSSDAILFKVGNNGATEAARVTTAGKWGLVGATAPDSQFQIGTGDNISWNTSTTAQYLGVRKGTSASPDTTLAPLLQVNRTMNLSGHIGDGSEQAAAMAAWAQATGTGTVQPVGIIAVGKYAGSGAFGDGAGVYAIGHSIVRTGIGGFFLGRGECAACEANGIETVVTNVRGVPITWDASDGRPTMTGIWINAYGGDRAGAAIVVNNSFGQQFDVGLGFTAAVAGGHTGGVLSQSIYDNSQSVTSIKISNTHTTAIDIDTGSGPIIARNSVAGGSATDSILNLKSTTGVGATDEIQLRVGNNGALLAGVVNNAGFWSFGSTSLADRRIYAYYQRNSSLAGVVNAVTGQARGVHTSGTTNVIAGLYGIGEMNGAGGTGSIVTGLRAQANNLAGTSTDLTGLYVQAASNTGTAVTRNSAIFLEAQTVGTSVYQIYSAGTAYSHFAGPIQIDNPATQVIAGGDTITDDACGTIKNISSASAVTTNTTDTFTSPVARNKGCVMTVCNVNATDTITLDKNARFLSTGGADVLLLANSCIEVISTGASGVWRQTTALQTSS